MIHNLINSTAKTVLGSLALLTTATVLSPSQAFAQIAVDAELFLLNDFSGSVDSTEYQLQVQGYVDAFKNLDFTGQNFAVSFLAWSGASQQEQSVGWTQITNNTQAAAFADAIAAALLPPTGSRPFSGNTAPGSAINAAQFGTTNSFGTVTGIFGNNFVGDKLIFDVSGDGGQNAGLNTANARNAAQTAGITINGLVISPTSSLLAFYNNSVRTTDGFVVTADTFADFGDAIEDKIFQEIIDPQDPPTVPEPTSTIALLGLGSFGLVSKLKRRQA